MVTEIHTSSQEISLLTVKLIALVSMGVIPFLFGLLPHKLLTMLRNNPLLVSEARSKYIISLCNCVSGGVFLGACFLDLIPDVEDSFKDVTRKIKEQYKVEFNYPVAHIVMALGLLMMMIMEQVVQIWAKSSHPPERQELLSAISHHSSYQSVANRPECCKPEDNIQEFYEDEETLDELVPVEHMYPSLTLNRKEDTLLLFKNAEIKSRTPDTEHRDERSHSPSDVVDPHGVSLDSFQSIMLNCVLSFHSIFEGMAIGLQDETDRLISILIAVTVHKALMATCIGLRIAQNRSLTMTGTLCLMFMFSISSPIGVGVGISVQYLPPSLTQDVLKSILQGISGGTFLHITLLEVLRDELSNHADVVSRWLKVLFVIMGYGCTCGLIFLTS